MEADHCWSLYKHTSPSGKVYIGMAKNVKHRWRANGNGYKGSTRIWYAIQKYGWDNFKHEILAENLSREEASELEKKTIREYRATDPMFGYNLTDGGYDGVQNEESRLRKSESLSGHPVSNEVREKLRRFHSIPIICLETMKVYGNSKDASADMGICSTSIGKNCNGVASHAGGFHFAKLSDFENDTIPIFKSNPIGRPVVCIETGKTYGSQREAATEYKVSSQAISHACTGKTETCAKMHWKFVTEDGGYGRKANI